MFRLPCSGTRFHNRGSDPFRSTTASEHRHFVCSPTIFFSNVLWESDTAP
jgi:hypothetical protein